MTGSFPVTNKCSPVPLGKNTISHFVNTQHLHVQTSTWICGPMLPKFTPQQIHANAGVDVRLRLAMSSEALLVFFSTLLASGTEMVVDFFKLLAGDVVPAELVLLPFFSFSNTSRCHSSRGSSFPVWWMSICALYRGLWILREDDFLKKCTTLLYKPRGTGHLFVTGKDPVMTGKYAQMTGFSRHLTGKIRVESFWEPWSFAQAIRMCERHGDCCATNLFANLYVSSEVTQLTKAYPEGLDVKFTRHGTGKTRHLRLC